MGHDRWYIGIWRSWSIFVEDIGGKIVFLLGYNTTRTYLFKLKSFSLWLRLRMGIRGCLPEQSRNGSVAKLITSIARTLGAPCIFSLGPGKKCRHLVSSHQSGQTLESDQRNLLRIEQIIRWLYLVLYRYERLVGCWMSLELSPARCCLVD
jgi:hypothetical protein